MQEPIQFFLFDTAPDPAFDRLSELVCAALDVPTALVSLVDDSRQFFKSARGLPEPWSELRETPLSHSFCQHVVGMGRELVVEDAWSHPLVRGNLAITDLGVAAYLGQPIHDLDGDTVGALCAINDKPRQWSNRDRRVMRLIARLADYEIVAAAQRYPLAPQKPEITPRSS